MKSLIIFIDCWNKILYDLKIESTDNLNFSTTLNIQIEFKIF